MQIPNISFLSSVDIERLKNGAITIFPTETIYGIGCSALCDESVARIFQIKGRAPEQPPPILIYNQQQLSILAAHISPLASYLIDKYWPGALTLILPSQPDLSPLLTGLSADGKTRTVGIRQTCHPFARVLCKQVSAPFIATSANYSGAIGREAAPESLADIPLSFQDQVDIIVDGGVLSGVPSTVVDCVSDPPRVLRKGAISLSASELQINF